jgi:hypothetical protein
MKSILLISGLMLGLAVAPASAQRGGAAKQQRTAQRAPGANTTDGRQVRGPANQPSNPMTRERDRAGEQDRDQRRDQTGDQSPDRSRDRDRDGAPSDRPR